MTANNDEEILNAHEEEFKILERLNHPNIVNGIELFRDNFEKVIYQVMELVEGSELLDEIAKREKYSEVDA